MLNEENKVAKVTVVDTSNNKQNGQDKCPKCGATEIETNVATGKLRCTFCRFEFEPEKLSGLENDINNLSGTIVTSGAQDISADAGDTITLKCSSCGAEVVINTSQNNNAKCHWCRSVLSINEQVPNGSVPDVVLPFAITKDDARTLIDNFVKKRKFYANPIFKKEFTTENIMGVYFPYMLVDINGHASFVGEGEKQVRQYTVGSDSNRKTYYDADVYHVERNFDIALSGLSIESSLDKLDTTNNNKTTNVINAIMPFDIENCVKYDSHYLVGYSSEKRDVNIDTLKPIVDIQAKDVARFAANDDLTSYDRGVAWQDESFNIKGEQWKAAYLPVWLYSYQEVKNDKKVLHYVAVNARTKETMGSVPIHMPKLLLMSFLVEIIGLLAMIFVDWDYSWLFLSLGIIYYLIIYAKYRNSNARHTYEKETKKEVSNMIKVDNLLEHRKNLSNVKILGCNNTQVNGAKVTGFEILKNDLQNGNISGNNIIDITNDIFINKK